MTLGPTLILVTTGKDVAVWRRPAQPMTVEKVPITQAGNCWRMDADFAHCRSEIDICETTCSDTSPPTDCIVTTRATWTDLASGIQQSWNYTGVR